MLHAGAWRMKTICSSIKSEMIAFVKILLKLPPLVEVEVEVNRSNFRWNGSNFNKVNRSTVSWSDKLAALDKLTLVWLVEGVVAEVEVEVAVGWRMSVLQAIIA